MHEDALRSVLSDDPNNERAFRALAEIVRRRAAEPEDSEHDPLARALPEGERQRAADLAVWSLGEELAGNPRAWYPLIEVARLSVRDDHEGTLRRLTTAAEREPTGRALAEGLKVLREADMPVDALWLGVGHWRPREHEIEVGRQLVLASIEAGRPLEAKQHLASLDMHPDVEAAAQLRLELGDAIAHAEQQHSPDA